MPIYPMVCGRGHRWERFYKVADKPTRCDQPHAGGVCGAPCESDYARLNVQGCVRVDRKLPDRRASVKHWHNPRDVARMRSELGGAAANCIQDDGSVVFNTPADRKAYTEANRRYQRRRREQSLEAEGKSAERKTPDFLRPTKAPAPDPVAKRPRDPKRLVGPKTPAK